MVRRERGRPVARHSAATPITTIDDGSGMTNSVLLAVATLVALATSDHVASEVIGAFVLTVIASPFMVLYLHNRRRRWAWLTLVPVYVLAAIVVNIGLQAAGVLTEELNAVYALFAVAVPFYALFAARPKNWWSLIPAGLLTIVGLTTLVGWEAAGYIGPVILVLLGIGIATRLLLQRRPAGDAVEQVTAA